MNNTISIHTSVQEALAKLEDLNFQTLFVLSEDGRMLGTLTDGDIRRGIMAGKGVNLKGTDDDGSVKASANNSLDAKNEVSL